jgi:hypothetical protein
MTVAELIDRLKTLDPATEVRGWKPGQHMTIDAVWPHKGCIMLEMNDADVPQRSYTSCDPFP